MEWIKCSERMPEGKCIAIGYQNEIMIGYLSGDVNIAGYGRMGTGIVCQDDHEVLTNVTHWMPLPEPPTDLS